MNEKKALYIKPINELHESGFKLIEVGYVNKNNGECEVVGRCSDAIHFGSSICGMNVMPKDLNIDVSPNGVINIWSYKDELEWQLPILSDAQVIVKRKEDNQWT